MASHYVNLNKYQDREFGAYEKAAAVVFHLAEGVRLTTAEIAQLTCQTHPGAGQMMNSLAACLPIDRDEDNRWYFTVRPKRPRRE